jgi:TonB family protein
MNSPLRLRYLAAAALTLSIAAAYHAPASAAAVCETPNVPARTILAAEAEIPALAASWQLFGTTQVQVDLDTSGDVLGASVLKTSGTPLLDQAAVEATRASKFQPEIRDCEPVAGSYIFIVDFPH